MQVHIHQSFAAASAAAAQYIRDAFFSGMRLGVATGSTPLGVYAELRRAHAADEFSLAGASAWALDEYVGLPAEHPQRYRNVLLHELVANDATGLTPAQLFTPDGTNPDPEQAARDYDRALGAGVDVQVLGIGANGHIGFNEPTGSFASRTHVGKLLDRTRNDNARFFDGNLDAVPTHCITQGLATIMSAKQILLLASGEAKAEAVAHAVEGAVSARWPVTVLQHHPRVLVVLDEAAASRLELRDEYEYVND